MATSQNSHHWFEVIRNKNYLFVIREKLENIDPRFYTTFDNMFLILGSHTALLIDTGCGLFALKPLINKLIGHRKLLVINTHSHFDHIGGNYEFDEIIIHFDESASITKPTDVSFLQDSPKEIVKRYGNINFSLLPAKSIKTVNDEDIIDLGEVTVRVIHTPGHSPGSISLLTNKGELFTGDTAHYGAMYISREDSPLHLTSLSKLINILNEEENIEIYPSHEEFPVDKNLLIKLREGIKNIENIWNTKVRDDFIVAWLLTDENFKYLVF
ncbi:MAG: MBL fold metallo-hydrolase [Promethearchaeota archaeon]